MLKRLIHGKPLFPFMNSIMLGVGEGGGDDDWKAGLPEPVREWEEVTNSDSPDKFWDQMTNMKSLIGQSIRIPSKEAGDADWKSFHASLTEKVPGLMPKPNLEDAEAMKGLYTALGKPDELGGYKVPEVDLKGVKVDMTKMEPMKKMAHDLNLTQSQFEGLVKEFTGIEIEKVTNLTQAQQTDITALKTEWGLAYDERAKAIANFADQTDAPEALVEAAKNGTLDANSMKWMHSIIDKFGPEGTNLTRDKSKSELMTPDEAVVRINEIMNNREHAYWVARDPGHKHALAEMLKLQKFAHPDASTDLSDLRAGGVSSRL